MTEEVIALLAKMRTGFVAELPERCDRIEEAVLALESDKDGSAYDELFRKVHSLKGSGGTFGLKAVTEVCHQFENFLTARHGHFDADAVSGALGYVDLLRAIAEGATDDLVIETVLASLHRLVATHAVPAANFLLVESSQALRQMCQAVFGAAGMPLRTASDEKQAETCLQQGRFALVMVSRELPDLPGPELIARLRASDWPSRLTPVVLVSSNPSPLPASLGPIDIVPRTPQLADVLLARARNYTASGR